MNLAGFHDFQLRRGLDDTTILSNIGFLKIPPPDALLTQQSFDAFISDKIKMGRKPNYLNRMIVAVRLYGHYTDCEWMQQLQKIRNIQQTEKKILYEDNLKKFLAAQEWNGNPTYKRHHEMMQLFWTICLYTGRRMGEIASLKQSEIRWDEMIFYLGKTKTGKSRVIPIYEPFEKLLKDYLIDHDPDLIFPKRQDKTKPIDHIVWGKSFRKRLKMIGIEKVPSLTAYSLRHSTITTTMSPLGGNLDLLAGMHLFGHTDPKITANYIHYDNRVIHHSVKKIPLAREFINPLTVLKNLQEWLQSFLAPLNTFNTKTDITEGEDYYEFTFKTRIPKKKDLR